MDISEVPKNIVDTLAARNIAIESLRGARTKKQRFALSLALDQAQENHRCAIFDFTGNDQAKYNATKNALLGWRETQ